jgi:hypothetical protein
MAAAGLIAAFGVVFLRTDPYLPSLRGSVSNPPIYQKVEAVEAVLSQAETPPNATSFQKFKGPTFITAEKVRELKQSQAGLAWLSAARSRKYDTKGLHRAHSKKDGMAFKQ